MNEVLSVFTGIHIRLEQDGYLIKPIGLPYLISDVSSVPQWCQEFRLIGYQVARNSIFKFQKRTPKLYVTFYSFKWRGRVHSHCLFYVEHPENGRIIFQSDSKFIPQPRLPGITQENVLGPSLFLALKQFRFLGDLMEFKPRKKKEKPPKRDHNGQLVFTFIDC